MLTNNYIEKLLGIQDVIVKNIEEDAGNCIIHMEMKRKKLYVQSAEKKLTGYMTTECKL